MTIHIALLRGVNVGGNKKIAMSELRDFCTSLGFRDPQSLLNSGNLVFRCDTQSGTDLERHLEAECEKRLGLHTEFFARTAKEWTTAIARNPFPDEANRDPGHFLVMCLKKAPAAEQVATLQAAITGREVVRAVGKQLYMIYPDGVGDSKLTNAVVDKHLATRGTARNWNTVLKLGALADA
jgi:uncharacterized protein (DUF1697 family)